MDVCKAFKKKGYAVDTTIMATAIVFFKRFYLYHSVVDYHPKMMLCTCVFLAAKVEHVSIPLEDFLKVIPNSPTVDQIKSLEFTLSIGLKFNYKVHHAFWPLHGFFLDMQAYLKKSASSSDALKEIAGRLGETYNKAKDYAQSSLLTDLALTHWPTQIAMACLTLAARETEFIEDLESYFAHRMQNESERVASTFINDTLANKNGNADVKIEETAIDGDEVFKLLRKRLVEVANCIRNARANVASKASCQAIDKKLQACKNPEFVENSLVSLKRQQDEAFQIDQKREAKKTKHGEKEADVNVFL